MKVIILEDKTAREMNPMGEEQPHAKSTDFKDLWYGFEQYEKWIEAKNKCKVFPNVQFSIELALKLQPDGLKVGSIHEAEVIDENTVIIR